MLSQVALCSTLQLGYLSILYAVCIGKDSNKRVEIRELVSSENAIYFERYLIILHSFCIPDTFSEVAIYSMNSVTFISVF